ncbi:MAG TPA: glycoside hydrolase N-terminal domain-containing protein [Terracidiphilus sp.]|nr:glycoside hydrolase N-terminal domain-containing protein [Terracidiphilus sp.]
MRRREFLKKGSFFAGMASSSNLTLPAIGEETAEQKHSRNSRPLTVAPEEIRSTELLHRARAEKYLPKAPVIRPVNGAADVSISPMPLEERLRRGIVPQRGFCSVAPAADALLISGNGHMNLAMLCDPYSEEILFRHESLLTPIRRPYAAPNIADIFPKVRQMVLDGKYGEAAEFAYLTWHERGAPAGHFTLPAFMMHLDFPKTASVWNYLRSTDFESTELKVHWRDERGEWVREIFTSRPDNVVVQRLTAAKGQQVNVRIALETYSRGRRPPGGFFGGNLAKSDIKRDFNERRLIYKCILDPSVNNSGYAGVVRVVRNGGSARMDGDTLVIADASSVMLLTRIEYFPEFSEDQVEALRRAVEGLAPDYPALLERARKVQSEMLNRVAVDFGGASQFGLSSEELLSAQRSSPGYARAYLEKLFEMCRYWFILSSGKYCSMAAETNANINLQIAPGVQGDHREGMEAYFNWMESLVPDFRSNARNIFGMRGAHYALTPNQQSGVDTHFDHADSTGETWPHPYWLSAGGWCVRPFWDHYLVTGDLDFLRNRVVPAYKDLALFYEDFLTVTDKDGNYIFAPGFSPENNPGNLDPSCMLVLNTSMDISVCREVLANLIEACELLGLEAESVRKWKAMLSKLPPCLLGPDGVLKEYAWPALADRYVHRHISHLYGAWPGDEIDPDRTPLLAKAAVIADRHRIPERLAAHGRCHRALVGARLKDAYMVDSELRQLIEEGNVGPTFRCSHDPYAFPMPDAQGAIQLIMIEMLAYSRPGVIEVLPALPPSLVNGSINGMLLRTFARLNKLSWDMEARAVDLSITSMRTQDVTLIARHGIQEISTSSGALASKPQSGVAACNLHLPEESPVQVHLELGRRNPMDWVNWLA